MENTFSRWNKKVKVMEKKSNEPHTPTSEVSTSKLNGVTQKEVREKTGPINISSKDNGC